jgi:hypothetical protein
MKTNRILMSVLAFVMVVAIATSGYMLGYASGRTTAPTALAAGSSTDEPATPESEPSKKSVAPGGKPVSSPSKVVGPSGK